MPVPSSINDLSTTPGSNSPAGSESPATFDDYMRTFAAFIAQLRDGKSDDSAVVKLTGAQTIAGVKTFSSAPVVPDASFSLAKLSTIATATVIGRKTAGTGVAEVLTMADLLTLIDAVGGLIPTGAIQPFARNTAPSGWLALPTAASNVSRTTYANLFAVIGTSWGAGDGSTTFGLPYLPEGYSPLGTASNVAAPTVGQVIAHTHGTAGDGISVTAGGQGVRYWGDGAQQTGSTGGSANLAAGIKFRWCIKL